MLLRLSYNLTRTFNKVYSAAIATLLVLSLAAIVLWTVITKTDCRGYTSPIYVGDKCEPNNLFEGSEVRQSHDGVIPFKYKETIANLSHDFKYRNNTYACTTMNYYRIVLSADRSTQINYNVSCHFDNGIPFTLIASTASNDVSFGWDGNYDAECPVEIPRPSQLLFFVFASNDNIEQGIPVGLNLKHDQCNITAWLDANGNIVELVPGQPAVKTKKMSINEYGRYKKKKAAAFAINNDMRFVMGYTCSDCTIKTGWDLVLTLLTALGSVGGIAYTVLIFVGKRLFERSSPSSSDYDNLELGKMMTHDKGRTIHEE